MPLALAFTLTACGEDEEEEEKETTDVKYSEIANLVNTSCATSGCHAAGVISPDLSSEAAVQENAAAALIAINNGTMPQAGATAQIEAFNADTDLKNKLIEYLGAQ